MATDQDEDQDPWAGIQDPFADVPPPEETPWGERLKLADDGQTYLLVKAAAEPTRTDVEQMQDQFQSGDSILDEPDEVPAVWGHDDNVLWAKGEALMIVGPAGVGKTTIVGQLVRARLGLSRTVLGYPVEAGQKKVLYLAMDRPRQIKRSLRRQFTADDREILAERLVVWAGPPPVDMAANTDVLVNMCKAADAGTVVVDSLKDAAIGLSEDAIGAGYNRARQAAIAAGVEVIELHHQRKTGNNSGTPNTLADVYGSTWITAGAGSVLCLWGSSGDPIVQMIHLKQPVDEVGPHRIMHHGATGTSQIHHGTDLVALARECRDGLTVDMAAANLYPGTDKRPRPTDAEVEKARRKLDALCKGENPLLFKVAGGPKTPTRYHATTGPIDPYLLADEEA
jgi:replicative DNA helicase